jgi:pimeloyl-ACP methyl ester carboxylesterase
MRGLSRLRTPHTRDLDEVSRIYESLADPSTRMAVRRVTSNVLNWHGQYITMTDRAYLARLMPLMVVWGKQDVVIPVAHAKIAMAYATSAEVHVLDNSGHFPHKDHPEEFSRLLTNFIDAHAPASYHRGKWRALLNRGDQAVLEAVTESSLESSSAV